MSETFEKTFRCYRERWRRRESEIFTLSIYHHLLPTSRYPKLTATYLQLNWRCWKSRQDCEKSRP